jgi:hypothetical protein
LVQANGDAVAPLTVYWKDLRHINTLFPWGTNITDVPSGLRAGVVQVTRLGLLGTPGLVSASPRRRHAAATCPEIRQSAVPLDRHLAGRDIFLTDPTPTREQPDQHIHQQDPTGRAASGTDQAARADRRVQEAIEDDDTREALKSLHDLERRCPKAG